MIFIIYYIYISIEIFTLLNINSDKMYVYTNDC